MYDSPQTENCVLWEISDAKEKMGKMGHLGDSIGCGLVRDMEWGNPIKMAVAAQVGVMEAWSIDG